MVIFYKPEAALQRAHEFISLGKEQDALQSLHDMTKDFRHKQWSPIHEQIMLKYVELCVNLKNSIYVKDGLHQYKNLTQQTALVSLENVLENFLRLAEQKTEEAQKFSIERVEEIDDLDADDASENLLLSFVSGAVTQDRMDRTVLSPWLRFLWDSYRNCLELLRNNTFVEVLYHQIARQSFLFCVKFQRRNEFRKLCDLLRLHLAQIQKTQTMSYAVKLTNADSLALMQETRLMQLDTAIQMELWQEAYKSAEDLHNMMVLSKDKDKKNVKPSSYLNYFDKLALIFWKGGNHLFHAASLLQKFNIYKDMKKSFSDEEAMDQATRVLLATLSIPDGADSPSILTKHLDIEEQHLENISVLSSLLRLQVAPTRTEILKEIARLNLHELAFEFAQSLYRSIEVDFDYLKIARNVQTALGEIFELNRPEYSQYGDSIMLAVATKVLKQISLIYDSLSLKRFYEFIPFYNAVELERFLVNICKHRSVKARIHHHEDCVRFGPVDAPLPGNVEIEVEEAELGLQNVRSNIENLYAKFSSLSDEFLGKDWETQLLEMLKKYIDLFDPKENDYELVLLRHKENSEQIKQEELQQAQAEANRKEEKRIAEEIKRLEEENIKNEQQRKLAEQEEILKKIQQDQFLKLKQNPIYQQIIKERGEEVFQTMDPEELLKEHRQRLDAERREQYLKLQQQEKKFDYNVRAFHFEEMKIRKEISDEKRAAVPALFEAYEEHRIEQAKQDYEKSILTYKLLTKARGDAKLFLREVIQKHSNELSAQRLR